MIVPRQSQCGAALALRGSMSATTLGEAAASPRPPPAPRGLVNTLDTRALRIRLRRPDAPGAGAFPPELLVGIRTGGLVVAEAMARAAPHAMPVMPLTCRRASTGMKSRFKLLPTHPGRSAAAGRGRFALARTPPAVHAPPHAGHRSAYRPCRGRGDRPAPGARRRPRSACWWWTTRWTAASRLPRCCVCCDEASPPDTQVPIRCRDGHAGQPLARTGFRAVSRRVVPLPMVVRCRRVEPVLIFDLDGTILRRNSFPIWAVIDAGAAWARPDAAAAPHAVACGAAPAAGAQAAAHRTTMSLMRQLQSALARRGRRTGRDHRQAPAGPPVGPGADRTWRRSCGWSPRMSWTAFSPPPPPAICDSARAAAWFFHHHRHWA